jgi:phosphohistidine phosphatase
MGTGRTLLVLRHAKAAGEPGVNDMERPLTGGGRRDAGAAGRWLLDRGITPDRVLCSPARRTRETWERIREPLGAMAPGSDAVSFEPRLYDAGTQDLLNLVNEQPGDAHTLLTVGHNPASGQLVAVLTGRSDIAFPACALAVIRLGESWAAVVPGGGELAELWTPRTPGLALATPHFHDRVRLLVVDGQTHAITPVRLRGLIGVFRRRGRRGPPPRPWTLRAGRAPCPGTARSATRRLPPGRPAWR